MKQFWFFWWQSFWESATDVFRLLSANYKHHKKLDAIEKDPEFIGRDPEFAAICSLNMDKLESLVDSESQRAKDLDEKLSKLTSVLSITLMISGVATKMISDGMSSTLPGTLAILLFFLAMAFLFCGVLIGFGGLRPKPRFGYGATYLHSRQEGGEKAEKVMKVVVSSYQVANLIRSNNASAASDLIRNGIITFWLSIALSVFGY